MNVIDTVSDSRDSQPRGQLYDGLHALGCLVETLLSFRHCSYPGGTHSLDAANENSGSYREAHKQRATQEAQGHWLLRALLGEVSI